MSLSQAFENVENAREFYAQWSNEIMTRHNPVEMDVIRDGNWQILCRALNIDKVPQEPFPKSNQAHEFRGQMTTVRNEIWRTVIVRTIFAVAVTTTVLATMMTTIK